MKAVARVGDVHACLRHDPNAIVSGGQSSQVDGRPVARAGDVCTGGGVIIEGFGQLAITGKGQPMSVVEYLAKEFLIQSRL